jgi:hypothetical protein
MTDEKKPISIEFAPGCFDNFEGTQEELEEMIAEITKMAQSGELFEKSRNVDLEELLEEEPEWAEKIIDSLSLNNKRNLQ